MPLVNKIFRASTDSYAMAFDYSGFSILTISDTISSAVASVLPAGLTLGAPTVDATNKKVSVNLSGGTSGVTYRVTCLATTTSSEVLTGLLDVVTNDNPTAGVVIFPSQLLTYIDSARTMQLLTDDGEIADSASAPNFNTIDGNLRAFNLAQSSWRTVVQACARGRIYSLQELTDYANDTVRGQDLVQLVADIFWCRLIRRRRYTPDDPQAQTSECKEAEEKLEQLRTGQRIFDLYGVIGADGTTYGNDTETAGALSTGILNGQRCEPGLRRFWGCTTGRVVRTARPVLGDPRGGCDGC